MRIFVDIDGTLTKSPDKSWGKPRLDIIEKVKKRIDAGDYIVVWSANGERYAYKFCEQYGIKPSACVGKPQIYVDDKKGIRYSKNLEWNSPEKFLERKDI